MNGRGNKSKSCGLELGQMVQVVLVVLLEVIVEDVEKHVDKSLWTFNVL